MISIEQNFYAQFPRLAQGRSREWSRPVVDLLRRITCETRINATLDALGDAQGFAFIERALEQLRLHYRFSHSDRDNIPTEGRVVIVANHPLGALDALALLHLVGSVRRDVKILANQVLMQLTALRPLLLPTAVFGDEQGAAGGLRGAYRALEREEALIVFPAGEVSRIRPTGVRDCDWNAGFLRFARRSGSPVLPVHINAHNSPVFYGVSMLAKPLATLLLPREMLLCGPGRISLTVGDLVPSAGLQKAAASDTELASAMRRHVYRLEKRRSPVFATASAIAHPESPARVRRALQAAELLGQTSDGKQIRLLDADPENPALREIGRLRELSFRKVGEGTGLRRDLDRFDLHYRHLVLWDEDQLEIIGAYRLGEVRRILPRRGIEGLYSASLFTFTPAAAEFLPQTVELGRSFIQPRYWGSRSLDTLWQGIGAYLRQHPELRYLIGPVSLSATLPEDARAWIVAYHAHYFGDPDAMASALNRYLPARELMASAGRSFAQRDARAGMALLKARLSQLSCAIPVLYRHYVELCAPDGVRFLAFGVDPAFGHCVDGLIRIDLAALKPAKRARYLGQGRIATAA